MRKNIFILSALLVSLTFNGVSAYADAAVTDTTAEYMEMLKAEKSSNKDNNFWTPVASTSCAIKTSWYEEDFSRDQNIFGKIHIEKDTYADEFEVGILDDNIKTTVMQKVHNKFGKLDDNFFKENALLVTHLSANSSSIKYKVKGLKISPNGLLKLKIKTKMPGIGTDDMATWYIFTVVKKSDLPQNALSGDVYLVSK